jgi:hypothetical protein
MPSTAYRRDLDELMFGAFCADWRTRDDLIWRRIDAVLDLSRACRGVG